MPRELENGTTWRIVLRGSGLTHDGDATFAGVRSQVPGSGPLPEGAVFSCNVCERQFEKRGAFMTGHSVGFKSSVLEYSSAGSDSDKAAAHSFDC